jgi:catechol 2,3-dioxygenase-like lactoylglutathione lyase family enzyme
MAIDRYIKKLFHVCITVPDIEEALEFYQGVLGLESVGSLRNEKTDGAALGFPGQEVAIHADHLSGKLTDNATVVDLISSSDLRRSSTRIPTGRQTTWDHSNRLRSKRYRCDLRKAPARAAILNSGSACHREKPNQGVIENPDLQRSTG